MYLDIQRRSRSIWSSAVDGDIRIPCCLNARSLPHGGPGNSVYVQLEHYYYP